MVAFHRNHKPRDFHVLLAKIRHKQKYKHLLFDINYSVYLRISCVDGDIDWKCAFVAILNCYWAYYDGTYCNIRVQKEIDQDIMGRKLL